ncbi:hypothetical protein [Draconibacterium sediminis]|uniref:Uncharacterized protein n=1 Tax=Draconibacterium sediminis TaxID=1544798 RepID=A0A0D8J4C2_9BACT|nr:hypothetical protein [Draconibacterium sediminis]KJF41619.1 hypothetical protein LH29_24525 [Draconibacterium sediminis]
MRYDNNIETMHQLSAQRGHEERSAIAERNRNRFLSSFGMTDKFADGRGNLATGIEKIADGRHRLPGGANNLPIDAFKLPIVGLNCRLTHLNCQLTAQTSRWEQKTTRGRLNLVGEHERWSGDASAWSVSTSFGPGTTQTARGRVNFTWGAVDMRVLENDDMWMKQEMEYEHFSSSQEEYVRQLADGRWCLNTISAPPHRCKRGPLLLKKEEKLEPVVANFLSSRRGNEERSVAVEQQSNRFLNRSSLGMTDKLATCNLQLVTELLTIKYNNPSSKRVAGMTKNAHLSVWKSMGTGDNKLFPFFLISSTLYISSPVGGSPEGEGGNGTFANTNKTSAYET